MFVEHSLLLKKHLSFAGVRWQMNTTLHENQPEDTQNSTNLYLEPHDYRIYYVNIDLRHQYATSVCRRVADVPPGETFPAAKSEEKRMFSQAKEIMALEETADGEMKEDDESVKGKAEKEKAKATDVRLKALEKVSETMKRHLGKNDPEKIQKRERRSDSETMLILSKKAEKDQILKLKELQLKKEQHDLDVKRLQASIDQQR